MYGPPRTPGPFGGAAGFRPQATGFSSLANQFFPPNPQLQNPNPFQNPFLQFPYLQNPSLPPFNPTAPPANPQVIIERAESAVAKVRQDFVSAGESVSAWKVSQAALVQLNVDSWSSLGFQLHDVPSIRQLLVIEGKVNAFIHCFVSARRISTLCDLEAAICENEGVEQFEELGLGPLLRHPLAVHYFSIPSDVTEAFRITCENVIGCLREFLDKSKKKMITPEEFLDFVAEQKSVSSKEKLGVRIRSLGLHISYIREARRAEISMLAKASELIKQNYSNEKYSEESYSSVALKRVSEKQMYDRRFGLISKRVKSFSSSLGNFEAKHIRFDSSDDDDENDSGEHEGKLNNCQKQVSNSKEPGQRVSSCPYPSTTEEMVRLGLKFERDEGPSTGNGKSMQNGNKRLSGRKRKFEEENQNHSCILLKNDQVSDSKVDQKKHSDFTLCSGDMSKFLSTWREPCREHTVPEVVDMMLEFYVAKVKEKRKTKKIFSVYPGVGLLNAAVTSIKCGMLDSLYHTFQGTADLGYGSQGSAMKDVGFTAEENMVLQANMGIEEPGHSVSVEEVIKKINEYIKLKWAARKMHDSPLAEELDFYRRLHDCEVWLTSQFSVEEFSSLGHGSFSEFLEKHYSLLPVELLHFFTGYFCKQSCGDAAMLHAQLRTFLSQAENNSIEGAGLTKSISMLLKKQFPTISFCILGNEPEKFFLDLIEKQKNINCLSCVVFSSTLLGKNGYVNSGMPFKDPSTKSTGCLPEVGRDTHSYGTASAKDAIECLLKAPMLSDLLSWSHWDIIYAPSLGSLLEWLLNEVCVKELSCIATTDGKLIRIDPSATVEEFLEALIRCSSFQVALKLLSLLSIYKGTTHAPISLLRCYAQRAFEVIMSNSTESIEVKPGVEKLVGNNLRGHAIISRYAITDQFLGASEALAHEKVLSENPSRAEKGVTLVSRFILDCLNHLPSEFRSFAADIFVTALRSVAKDANLTILHECFEADQRLMLHDIGLSLGIIEWIEDYHAFSSETVNELLMTSQTLSMGTHISCPSSVIDEMQAVDVSNRSVPNRNKPAFEVDDIDEKMDEDCTRKNDACLADEPKGLAEPFATEDLNQVSVDKSGMFEHGKARDANLIVESIRREEFGLDPNLNYNDSCLLKKQHARLGRALNCLSQELYSQDSHLLLELVQNADDNVYLDNVDPTLVLILQETGIVVLNNEEGFAAENIKALCDIGNSTKKGSAAGYIGNKGIGFKSVFRVTDAPEIHSNGFHIKFDITEGQIGFILPTVVSPCDIDIFLRLLSGDESKGDKTSWNTCILLPFRSQLKRETSMSSIVRMFSDLHPSLLLFLHRLRCIKFRNMLDNSLLVMRKENLGYGIVKVSCGINKMSWLLVRKKLQATVVRPNVQSTEIAMAFTLQEEDGMYKPHLVQQPVFAFLPLRTYGLKFILQGDFVLPSSREDVDVDSAWNQWLLTEFPSLFASAEQSFCALPCFQKNPGRAVTAYMSFIPLSGEVHGFFSHLPYMIISKLRKSNCLLLDGPNVEWVLPCRALRGWNAQARSLISDCLLQKHLGLCYLNKEVILSDSLAKSLGVQDYGPKILVDILSSICHTNEGIKPMGLDWLSSCLYAVYCMLSVHSSGHVLLNVGLEYDVISCLKRIPFIPLSDGSYSSVADGPIWLPCEVFSLGFNGKHINEDFPHLYAQLRIVDPLLLNATSDTHSEGKRSSHIIQILHELGVQDLSAHEIIKNHILVAISAENNSMKEGNLMVEYLSFIMLHFQSACSSCYTEKASIISVLCQNSVLLTNHGYRCSGVVPIHFGKEYGNPVDIGRLIESTNIVWHEIDIAYLKHPITQSLPGGLMKWRDFLHGLGITDFVQVNSVSKKLSDVSHASPGDIVCHEDYGVTLSVSDWESPELVQLLSMISLESSRNKGIYLMEVLDRLWDDIYSSRARSCIFSNTLDKKRSIESSFMKCIHEFKWIASTLDDKLYYPKDLFFDCAEVRSVLGVLAPYAIPRVTSRLLLEDICFKTQVSLDDALSTFKNWRMSKAPFTTSIAQMSKFYTFISDKFDKEHFQKTELVGSPFIFIPLESSSGCSDFVSGELFSPRDVYWHDPTGCIEKMNEMTLECTSLNDIVLRPCKALATVYPSLHDFFVRICGVCTAPTFGCYVQILLQLATVALPSQSAHLVFRVLLKWADDFSSGLVGTKEVLDLKENLHQLENKVLPTLQDRWVSLHPSFGIICWSDNEKLKEQFKHSEGVDFLHFGVLNDKERDMMSGKVATFLQKLGVPALSQVVSREAIFYGQGSNKEIASLIIWLLPYVQRYIYKLHPDLYTSLTQLGFGKAIQLQIVVVEKLFFKHALKGCASISKKRFECAYLLQGNVFYATENSDFHSMFLELSRLFFDGSPDLHLANFLHMITTMGQSGYAAEQIEFFVVNSQKINELPAEESVWSLLALPALHEGKNVQPIGSSTMNSEHNVAACPRRKPGIALNWPPTDWKTAPDFRYAQMNYLRTRPGFETFGSAQNELSKPPEVVDPNNDPIVPVEIDGEFVIEEGPTAAGTIVLQDSALMKDQAYPAEHLDSVDRKINFRFDHEKKIAGSAFSPDICMTDSSISDKDVLCLHTPDENQTRKTGRLGEIVSYKYFSEKLGSANVKWVNEETESGSPYDLVLDAEGRKEYIEVKTTKSATKDWFPITANEWQFAALKGDTFSIAHVVLLSSKKAKLTILKNPIKLCQQNQLHLAVLMSKQLRDSSVAS